MIYSRVQAVNLVQQATAMHGPGMSWDAVAETLGVSRRWLMDWRYRSTVLQWATEAELRFHLLRLGSRKRVAELYGVSPGRVYAAAPALPFDHYIRGMMVNIGGVLAKKCAQCGVARELESYWSDPSNKSGCRQTCSVCRSRR